MPAKRKSVMEMAKGATKRFIKRHPEATCPGTPTLYASRVRPKTGKDLGPRFHPTCHLVVVALNDVDWKGFWGLSEREADDLREKIDGHTGKGSAGDGKLTWEEIKAFTDIEEHRKYIEKLPSSLRGILVLDIVEEAIFEIDGGKNVPSALDKSEWHTFLDNLEAKHCDYLHKKSLLAYQAFYGRSQPWWKQESKEHSDMTIEDMYLAAGLGQGIQNGGKEGGAYAAGLLVRQPIAGKITAPARTFQCGCSEGGFCSGAWRADLFYYSANTHPIHGIFGADPNHPLAAHERILIELSVIGFSIFTVMLKIRWVDDGMAPHELLEDPTLFGLLVCTLPGMALFQILLFLFTCPKCGVVDLSRAEDKEVKNADRCRKLGKAIAILLMTVSFAFVVAAIQGALLDVMGFHLSVSWGIFWMAVHSRLRSYVISWCMMVLLPFNPVVAWGQPSSDGGCSLGDLIGLGKWTIQRQQFQLKVQTVLSKIPPVAAAERKQAPTAKPTGYSGWAWALLQKFTCKNEPSHKGYLEVSDSEPIAP